MKEFKLLVVARSIHMPGWIRFELGLAKDITSFSQAQAQLGLDFGPTSQPTTYSSFDLWASSQLPIPSFFHFTNVKNIFKMVKYLKVIGRAAF